MPELPEVETVRRSLEPLLKGKSIINVEVNLPKLIKIPFNNAEVFKKNLQGKLIDKIERRGKYLLFLLEDNWILVIHLRMTGRLLYMNHDCPVEKHTHLIFYLDNQQDLRFHDVRQFGLIYLVKKNDLQEIKGLANLGVEPLNDDFTAGKLIEMIGSKKQKVKSFLLEQKYIAGIGNIYADEILFQAKIHPEEPVNNLTEKQINMLLKAIKDRLTEGIRYGGTSIKDYVDGLGNTGQFQKHLYVYGKSGEPCLLCGTQIERKKVGGRNSHYCPHCQAKKVNT